jgi:hypothetical protein
LIPLLIGRPLVAQAATSSAGCNPQPAVYNTDVRRVSQVLLAAVISAALGDSLAAQQPPAPQPFPRSGGGPPTAAPAPPPPVQPAQQVPPPAAAARPSGAPTDAMLGVPGVIYPTSDFLKSFDIGRGQRCYLFGTNASFVEMVTYYRQVLKDGGRELFKAPAMQQFDLGKFQDQTMAYPPSVVVKDYASGTTEGYLQVDGTRQRRFKTIVQIVPMPGK